MDKKWVVIIIIGLVAVIAATNYQKIYKTVVPPKPLVVSSTADESSSRLFEYSMKVKASISNQGGDGDVVVEATAYQNSNQWTKTKNLHMGSYQTSDVEFIFDEVKFLGKTPQYNVSVHALGL